MFGCRIHSFPLTSEVGQCMVGGHPRPMTPDCHRMSSWSGLRYDPERLDSDNQINKSRFICVLGQVYDTV
jgi:hypothetical protein